MSTDAPFTPPRKKISILWWLLGFFLLLIFIFVFQLFGPNPRIIISSATTYITQPLGPDGLPDYNKYVLDLSREGVTPENNAAAILLKALWPGELDPPQYEDIAKELGWDQIPSAQDALSSYYGRPQREQIADWLRKNAAHRSSNAASSSADELLEVTDDTIFEIQDRAMSRPWKSDQLPPLANWIRDNPKPFDLLIEGSRRSRCYLPSPTLLDDKRHENPIADFSGVPDSLDHMERAMYIDTVIYLSHGGSWKRMRNGFIPNQPDPFSILQYASVDWNVALRKGNQFYDRYVAAARLPDRAARTQANALIYADINRLRTNVRPESMVTAAFSPAARSDVAASILMALLLPALDVATNAQDRANAKLQLTRLAAALAVYRAEHGSYPDKLDDLVPDVLEILPLDLYTAKPFFYKRDGDGFLLYGAGPNGNDDGGSNEQMGGFSRRRCQ